MDWVGRKAWKVSGRRGRCELAAAVDSLSDAAGWNQQGAPFVCLVCRHGALSRSSAGRSPAGGCGDIDLGRVDDDGVLSKLNAWERRRTDYTVQEVRTATERAYELECEARRFADPSLTFDTGEQWHPAPTGRLRTGRPSPLSRSCWRPSCATAWPIEPSGSPGRPMAAASG